MYKFAYKTKQITASVSYTHLDVYKRQAKSCTSPLRYSGMTAFVETSSLLISSFNAMRIYSSATSCIVIGFILFVLPSGDLACRSLCKYKAFQQTVAGKPVLSVYALSLIHIY